jgi:hypothetical protein
VKLLSLKYKVIDKPVIVRLAVQTKLMFAIMLTLRSATDVRPSYWITAKEL